MTTDLPVAVVETKTKTVWTPKDILPRPCPTCGKHALVQLTGKLLADQPDGTNIVCHPGFGGCNCGFEMPALQWAGTRQS